MRKVLLLLVLLLPAVALSQNQPPGSDPQQASQSGSDEVGAAPLPGGGYIELEPSFVTNYGGAGPLHYLKTDIVVRVSSEAGINAVRHHMPLLRHRLVMLLSRQMPEDLATMEGKELLRQQALLELQQVLEKEEGAPYIEDLLFNSFLVQR